ncbi:hypothetical protein H632_c3980p0 [Helicosporidium sp. ATCC 50920]|nr:hypothetical protein H632_c3980p0 [Helicosporidium sp. ATCC 50920]|eukprot:KDD72028.1 hypothetical protein H632_c3980p0 [Helicosporidium sp. ATCC 50920]
MWPGERGLALEAAALRDVSSGATKPTLAVGLGFAAGEDYPCTGRVALYHVPRKGAQGWELQALCSREFRGPVTALQSLEHNLLVATGSRLELCVLSSEAGAADAPPRFQLQRAAFYDGPMLMSAVHVIKNFALAASAHFGIQFVVYKAQGRQLQLLSRDFGGTDALDAQLLLAGSSLALLAADGGGTLSLFSYAPAHPDSWKGQRLLHW